MIVIESIPLSIKSNNEGNTFMLMDGCIDLWQQRRGDAVNRKVPTAHHFRDKRTIDFDYI